MDASESDAAARSRAGRVLAAAGRHPGAERAVAQVLDEAPDDADALNFLALRAHARGDAERALRLLEHARRVHADDAVTLGNLGVLYRERGRLDEAHEVLVRAVRREPDAFFARLRLGETLQALGRDADALPAYFGAIVAAQRHGAWFDDASTPPPLRPLVRHAMRFVAAGRRDLFSALLAPLRERHGGAALARVERCLAMYLGDEPLAYGPARQRPTFLYFPGLPSPRYFERELFPWYDALEAQAPAIRAELLAVLAGSGGFEPFLGHVDDPQRLREQLRGEGGAPAWDAYFFFRHGERHDDHARQCPRTAAALDAAPLCRIREHAPEVCYSLLAPGTHILPHYGVTNTRVVTHLPLRVPDGDLALEVGGERRRWEEGCCFSFDDTYEHEAWNRSGQTRVVMLLDAWNPYLSEVERDALTALIGAIGDFNRAAAV
jgi:aspartate beta-hydroxylase